MRDTFKKLLPVLLFFPFFTFITFFFYQRLGAFGCGDDCFNITGGYLLNHGQSIYSGFFFNHAPFMAYISALIQSILKPDSLYRLILYHRLTLYAFSLIFGILITLRFRYAGLLFLVVYESIKFYFFGDRFLAEGFVVYPLVYMLGTALDKFSGKEINKTDLILTSLFAWFTIFSREPYALVALFILTANLWMAENKKHRNLSGFLFVGLSLFTLLLFPIRDFYTNVFVYNQDRGFFNFLTNVNPIKNVVATFLYPVYALFVGRPSLLRFILALLTISFVGVFFDLLKKNKFRTSLFILIALGLANIRYEVPGFMYYQAFHMTVWFALFIFTISYFVLKLNTAYRFTLLVPITGALIASVISPESFLRIFPDKVLEFKNNYLQEYIYSTAIKALSSPNQTVFVDGRDELILTLSDRPSSYRYSWYTSFMSAIPLYIDARKDMIKNNPPDFYYDACFFPKNADLRYHRLLIKDHPSCLLVREDQLGGVTNERLDSIQSLGFSLN